MNGRQRTLAAIQGRVADRVPVAQHNFPFVARHCGLTMRAYREDPHRAARALADCAYEFGYDCIIHDVDTASLAEAMGAGCAFPDDEPARVDRPAVSSLREIVDLPLPDPERSGRLPFWLEVTRELRRLVGDELAIMARADQGPFGLAFILMDSQQFMMDLLETDEQTLHAALEHCAVAGSRFAAAQLAAGADMTSIGDSAAGQSVVSPRIYRQFAYPAENLYRQLVGDGLLSLHICGQTDRIVGDMVKTGFEILELDHCNDLVRTFSQLPDDVCIFGNIDPSSVLCFGTPELVRERCRHVIQLARDHRVRFVLCPGCVMMANTPVENVRAMIEAAQSS